MYIPILITLLLAPTTQAEDTHDPDSRSFNVVAYSPAVPQEIQTVEIIGADTRATTFKYECLDSASRYVAPTGLWETLDTTTRPSHPSTMISGFTCDSYTYTQGPSTWAMSFTGLDVTYSGSCTKSARDRDFDSCEAAIEYDPSMNRANEGGFGMTNWMSNNRTVLAIVDSTCKSKRGHKRRFGLNNAYHVYCQ